MPVTRQPWCRAKQRAGPPIRSRADGRVGGDVAAGARGECRAASCRAVKAQPRRVAGIFDGVIDFDAVTSASETGALKAEHQPNSSTGGPGDKLHPNRTGYMAMGLSVDPKITVGP